jgi:MFS family permease
LLKLLRQRNFSLLWIGQFISVIGDWVLFIALPFYTYNLTGSVLATGTMFIVSTLPRLVLGSVAGVFVDRWDRKRTMIAADLVRVLITLVLLLVRSRDWLWLIYASAFLEAVVSQFFNPAKSAIIPLMVEESDLLTANSLNGFSDALTRLLGSALGGMLMGWLGFSSVVWLDAGTFLFSGIMIWLIVMPIRPASRPRAIQASFGGKFLRVWHDWIAGLNLVKRERLLLALFIVFGVASLGDSMLTVLVVPLVKDLMGGGPQLLGWLMMAEGLGGVAGGVLVGKFGKYVAPRYLASAALGFVGSVIIILITFPHSIFIFPLIALVGLLAIAWFTSAETLLQLGVSDEYRGRIFGTLGTTLALASLAGMLIAGTLSDRIGLVPILTLSGSLYILSGLFAWIMLPRALQLQANQPDSPNREHSPQRMPAN